jgi:ribonuclease P protein component
LLPAGAKEESGLLPKRERISGKGRIKELLTRKCYYFSSPLLKLIAEENNNMFPRWVVICSKRLGNAVARNRIRRVYQAAICKIRHNIVKNIDVVVVPRQENVSSAGLEQLLIRAVAGLRQ